MASTEKYVPEELQDKILLSLPVKSLLRFKSVCKSWNRYISSKSFCSAHLTHNKTSKKYLLFDHGDFYSAYLINTKSCVVETSDHIGCFKPKLLETSVVQYGSYYLNVHGICNGILCLSDGQVRLESTIYLWNPIARRGLKIPNPYETSRCGALRALAFGYHDDDYKVIKMERSRETYYVHIYSLSINDWKYVTLTDPDYIFYDYRDDKYMENTKAVIVNNVAYFLKKDPYQVICFDISCEIIRTVNFPEEYKADSIITVKAFGESIALVEYCQSGICIRVVMWILSGKLIWEKRFSVDFEDSYPLGFTDDGNIMQFEISEWDTIWGIDSFTESLVLLDQSNMDEYFVRECPYSANTMTFTLGKWKIHVDQEEETE